MLTALRQVSNLVSISYQDLPSGILAHISFPKISAQYHAIRSGSGTCFFVAHIYTEGSYIVSYIEVNAMGKIVEIWGETEGVLPRLFHAPDASVWVCLTYLKTPRDTEITIPLFHRERVQKLDTTREFAGRYVDKTSDIALLYNDDTGKDYDQFCKLVFDKNNLYKQRKLVKIPAPKNNLVYLDKAGQIHLLKAESMEVRFHRLFDLDGNLLRERKVKTQAYFISIISLDFDQDSYYICTEKNQIFYATLGADGNSKRQFLIEIPNLKENFYGFEPPIYMGKDRYIFKFMTEIGAGWLVMEGNKLLECFISDTEGLGFLDLVHGNSIILGYDAILAAIEAPDDTHYSVLFHKSGRDLDALELFTRTLQ